MKKEIILMAIVLIMAIVISMLEMRNVEAGGVYLISGGQSVAEYTPSGSYIFKNLTVNENMTVGGTLFGGSPLRMEENVLFVNLAGDGHFSLYHAEGGQNYSHVPDAFNDSMIFETLSIQNPYKMEVCFWDNETQKMFLCINEGAPLRATTVRRSLQIVGNTTDKENDENFTLCENVNYIDCSTDLTGADLFVDDDIEARGSIYANENIVSGNNISSDYMNADFMEATNMSADFSTANRMTAINMSATLGSFTTVSAGIVSSSATVSGVLISGDSIILSDLVGSYSNGESYVCVYDNGTLFAKDSACS